MYEGNSKDMRADLGNIIHMRVFQTCNLFIVPPVPEEYLCEYSILSSKKLTLLWWSNLA